jgi:hypothetical protein
MNQNFAKIRVPRSSAETDVSGPATQLIKAYSTALIFAVCFAIRATKEMKDKNCTTPDNITRS